jgi:hypothetical protein
MRQIAVADRPFAQRHWPGRSAAISPIHAARDFTDDPPGRSTQSLTAPLPDPDVPGGHHVPELLTDGLPNRAGRSKFDFTPWADGQAWKFVRGEDYESATETFRTNVRKWAKSNGLEVELRPYAAVGDNGEELPLTKADAVALGVRFVVPGSSTGVSQLGARREAR